MPQTISLLAAPSQTLTVNLDGQQVGISLYTGYDSGVYLDKTSTPAAPVFVQAAPAVQLFADISLAGVPVLTGKLCGIAEPLFATSDYVGFEGELIFVDTENLGLQDSTQPQWAGLGSQYQLIYYTAADVAAGLA
jgi:hypothetical protein